MGRVGCISGRIQSQIRGDEKQEDQDLKTEAADMSEIVVIRLRCAKDGNSLLGVMAAKGHNAKVLIKM